MSNRLSVSCLFAQQKKTTNFQVSRFCYSLLANNFEFSCVLYLHAIRTVSDVIIVFLDRHSIKCDSNKVLTQIQLKTEGTLGQSGYKIQNVFSCAVPVYPVNTCVEYYTDYAERGSSTGMIYIDKHDITCKNAGELLQGFGLQTRGSDTFIRFSFTCCSLKN